MSDAHTEGKSRWFVWRRRTLRSVEDMCLVTEVGGPNYCCTSPLLAHACHMRTRYSALTRCCPERLP